MCTGTRPVAIQKALTTLMAPLILLLKYGLPWEVPQPTRVVHEKRLRFPSSSVPQRVKNSTKPPESTKLRQTDLTLPKPNRPALTLLLTLNYVIGRECFTKSDFFPRLLFPVKRGKTNKKLP